MADTDHRSIIELEAGLGAIRRSPLDKGNLQLIVRRPIGGGRERLDEAELDAARGLVGDKWEADAAGPDRFDTQLTVMNSHAAALVAGPDVRWAMAGDQIFIDIDLSAKNLPAGTRLSIGPAVIEINGVPHTGCRKFAERFGADALKVVNSAVGKELNLRGRHARVVEAGIIRIGDPVRKIKD